MALLSDPTDRDVFVNLGCGSGSLLIERSAAGGAGQVIGVDNDAEALACASVNISAAHMENRVALQQGDVRQTAIAAASVDVICADLPFGQLVGSHAENIRLYPALFAEAARICRIGGRFVVITHEVRLMEQILAASPYWRLEEMLRITLRGLHPRIYKLERTTASFARPAQS
jgi:23S rRNA G2445 N2-methylase RlmL